MKEEWNRSVDHPLQSWEWGEFRKLRQSISRVNGMLIMWTRIPFTPWCFGYIPMGKMPDVEDITALRTEGLRMKAVGIRMEPNVTKNENGRILKDLQVGRGLFKPKTIILNLTKSEEELLKSMHPKGRYNIRVALKHEVQVREDNSPEAFEAYLKLMFQGTAARQKIYSHGEDYHRLLWENLKNNIAHLFTATYQGEILVADIIFNFNNNIFYAYGASALEHKEVMAPTLLLWEIIKWGKNRHCKMFDLWGAEEGKGFSRFKEQFGGETIETVGTFDLPVNKWLYPLFRVAEEVRWKILRIIK